MPGPIDVVGPIDIVIRSYYRDLAWLRLALASVDLFATGFRRVVVVFPSATWSRVDLPTALPVGPAVCLRACPDHRDDYLGQQITKLYADRYTDADVIVHLDSDQVFVAPCDLRSRLFDGSRPRICVDTSGRRPVVDGWRRFPETFLRRPIPYDLATPLPLTLHRRVHAGLRAFCRRTHRMSIAEYARRTPTDRFCELALLRAYALLTEATKYSWMDLRGGDPVPECRTFWSRAQTPGDIAHLLPPELAARIPGSSG